MRDNQENGFGIISTEPGFAGAGAEFADLGIAETTNIFGIWAPSRKTLRDTITLVKDRAGVADSDVIHSCIKQRPSEDEGWTAVFRGDPAKIKKIVGKRVLRDKKGEHDYYAVAA